MVRERLRKKYESRASLVPQARDSLTEFNVFARIERAIDRNLDDRDGKGAFLSLGKPSQ